MGYRSREEETMHRQTMLYKVRLLVGPVSWFLYIPQRSRNALHYFSFNMVPPKTRKSIALANQVGNSLYWAARCRGWLPYNFQHVRRRTQRTQCFIGYQEIRRSNTNHHILGHLPWWRESNQVDATRQVWGKPQRTQPARFAFLVYKTEASVSDRETLFCF